MITDLTLLILVLSMRVPVSVAQDIQPGPRMPAVAPGTRFLADGVRPLNDAMIRLQELGTKPVITYEDAILEWTGDVQVNHRGNGLLPRRGAFAFDIGVWNGQLEAALVDSVVAAYHAQVDGPRFAVLSSTWGLHIVPVEIRDRSGRFRRTESLLDTTVSVTADWRTAGEHLAALCAAVTEATPTGVRLEPFGPTLNGYFAANAYRVPRKFNDDDRLKMLFSWGVLNIRARDALITLLEGSASTLTWKLYCEAGAGYCVLNMLSVSRVVTGPGGIPQRQALAFDRCQKCPN